MYSLSQVPEKEDHDTLDSDELTTALDFLNLKVSK